MVGAVRGRGVAEKAPVHERRVERPGKLVAGVLHQRRDRRVEIGHERDHVDHRLCRQTGHGGGAEVVNLHPAWQRREPLSLCRKRGRARGVVRDDLHLGVTHTGSREVFGGGSAAFRGRHLP